MQTTPQQTTRKQAASAAEIRAQLTARSKRGAQKNTRVSRRRPSFLGMVGMGSQIKASDITKLIGQLASMMRAGIPLVQSFAILAHGLEKKALKQLVNDLQQQVYSGHSLTAALRHRPQHFDALLCNLIDIGEQSGVLDSMLERVARHREKAEQLKRKIQSALTYPAAVILIAIAITWLLLVQVVPQFETMFQGFGAELPAFTRLVIDLSYMVQQHWLAATICLCTLLFVMKKLYATHLGVRLRLDRLLLRLPLVGKLIQKTILARYAHTLATTSAAGAPLVTTLRSMADNIGNRVYEQAIEQMVEDVAAGQSLHLGMQTTGVFPPMMTQMIAIGEETGMLAEMLEKAASYYEAEVETAVDRLTQLIEPAVICILGVLTGGLIIAMYLPIFDLGKILGGNL